MNARQKAKKYKRELEQLKKTVVKPVYIREERNIRTFKTQHIVPTYEARFYNYEFGGGMDRITRDLIIDLFNKGIGNYIDIERRIDTYTGDHIYEARIDVVERQ